jgi:hypothetical protein
LAYPGVQEWEDLLFRYGCVGAILLYNLLFSRESHTESAAKEYDPTYLFLGSIGINLALIVARVRQKYLTYKETRMRASIADGDKSYGSTASAVVSTVASEVSQRSQIQQSPLPPPAPSLWERTFCCCFRHKKSADAEKLKDDGVRSEGDARTEEETSRRLSTSSL